MDGETEQATSNTCDKVANIETLFKKPLALDEKKPACDLCCRTFSSKKYLRRHLLTHAPKRIEHSCDLCNKAYSRKDALKRHLLTHTEERPHVCDMCNEAFSRKDELSKHFLTHSTRSLHTCYKCQKAFSREDSLKRHILTHTGEKLHICLQCNKTFSRRDELIKHFVIHTYPRPGTESNFVGILESNNDLYPAEKLKTRLIIHIKRRKPLKVANQTTITES